MNTSTLTSVILTELKQSNQQHVSKLFVVLMILNKTMANFCIPTVLF